MKILGVDPGTLATGWGLIETLPGRPLRSLGHGVIRTRAADPLWDRLAAIHAALTAIAADAAPDALALEHCFVGKNVQSALKLGHTRGVVMIVAKTAGAALFEYTPTQVKNAVTGTGRAEKHQVAEMVRVILNLPAAAPADASDALALAICHSHGAAARLLTHALSRATSTPTKGLS